MKIISVNKVCIDYCLVCPDCGAVYWLNQAQYDDYSYHTTCECGCKFKPNRIPKEKPLKHEDADDINSLAEIIEVIIENKKEAQERARKVFDRKKDISTLVREAICI